MTRKQYRKKARQLQRNIARYAKKTGGRKVTTADRVSIPIWGTVIGAGKHEGEVLRSYEQCWDMMRDALKGTDLLAGIN